MRRTVTNPYAHGADARQLKATELIVRSVMALQPRDH